MKHLIVAFLLIISILTAGCGGGGGDSSKPTTIVTAPTISNVTTESASTYTVATISGAGFGLPVSSSYVTYSGQTYNATTWNDTTILVTVPFNAVDPLAFRVVVNNVTSNAPLNVTNTMRIFNISPSTGNPGTVITISGQGFGASQVSGAYVTFYEQSQPGNYQTAAVSNWTDSSITCTVPANLTLSQTGSVQIGITVWKSSSIFVSGTFNLILPSISNIDPLTDNVGATVTIKGQGFGSTQNTSYARIGGSSAPVVSWSDNQVRVRVPDFNAPGVKTIELIINNRTISNSSFSVAGPEIVQFNPSGQTSIGKDETFTITGRHFGAAADFDGFSYTRSIQVTASGNLYNVNPVNWSDSQITFAWPVPNTIINKTATVVIYVGGLSATITNIQAK